MRRELAEQTRSRSMAQVEDDIARCNWLRSHLPDLGDVLNQDRVLKRLTDERNRLSAGASEKRLP